MTAKTLKVLTAILAVITAIGGIDYTSIANLMPDDVSVWLLRIPGVLTLLGTIIIAIGDSLDDGMINGSFGKSGRLNCHPFTFLLAGLIALLCVSCSAVEGLKIGSFAFTGSSDQWGLEVRLEEGQRVYYYTDKKSGREFRCTKTAEGHWNVELKDPKTGIWLSYDAGAKGGLTVMPLPPVIPTAPAVTPQAATADPLS